MDTMDSIEPLTGSYQGTGVWHDAAGTSMTYTVRQTTRATADGFELAFTHDFADGSVVNATFRMTWIAPHLFCVAAGGTPVGHGYVFDACCHYHLQMPDRYVEASYRAAGGVVEVLGSSTRNAEGHYIAWKEVLRPLPDTTSSG